MKSDLMSGHKKLLKSIKSVIPLTGNNTFVENSSVWPNHMIRLYEETKDNFVIGSDFLHLQLQGLIVIIDS